MNGIKEIYCNHCYYYAAYLCAEKGCLKEKIYYKSLGNLEWKFESRIIKNNSYNCSDFKQATFISKFRNKLLK